MQCRIRKCTNIVCDYDVMNY